MENIKVLATNLIEYQETIPENIRLVRVNKSAVERDIINLTKAIEYGYKKVQSLEKMLEEKQRQIKLFNDERVVEEIKKLS